MMPSDEYKQTNKDQWKKKKKSHNFKYYNPRKSNENVLII